MLVKSIQSADFILLVKSGIIIGFIIPVLTGVTSAPSCCNFAINSFVLILLLLFFNALEFSNFLPSSSASIFSVIASIYGTVIFLPNSGLFSKKSSLSFSETTSPTTIIAGDVSFAFSIFSPISASVPIHLRCAASVPFDMTAAGVSALRPAFMSPAAMLFTCASPIKNTQVIDSSVRRE